jgi:putative SOS response-associated peptidase YedK
MCGRFTLRTPIKDVAELFDLSGFDPPPAQRELARYNIAPTQEISAVRWDPQRHGREWAWLRWGLVPSWADDPAIGNQLINARAETVATKPAFRAAFRARRCLVPADGFYEWKRQDRGKQPYYIRLRDDRPFAFAGLYDRWHRGESVIESCTIITTDSNDLVGAIHNRMPVILDRPQFAAWLDPAIDDPRILTPLLVPYPAARMVAYPVSTNVNSPRFDAAQCIEAVPRGKSQGSLFD